MQVGMQVIVDITVGEFEDWETFWKHWDGLTITEKLQYIDEAHHAEIMQATPWRG